MSSHSPTASDKKPHRGDPLYDKKTMMYVYEKLIALHELSGRDPRYLKEAEVLATKLEGMDLTIVEPSRQAGVDLLHMLIRGTEPFDWLDALKVVSAYNKYWPELAPVDPQCLLQLSASLRAGALGGLTVPVSLYPSFIYCVNRNFERLGDITGDTGVESIRFAHSDVHAMRKHHVVGNRPSISDVSTAGGEHTVTSTSVAMQADRFQMSQTIGRIDQWIDEIRQVCKGMGDVNEEHTPNSPFKNLGSLLDAEDSEGARSRAKRCLHNAYLKQAALLEEIHWELVVMEALA